MLFWPSRQPRLRSPEPGAQWALRAHLALKANPPLFRRPGPQRRAPCAERPRFASLSAPRGRTPVRPLCRMPMASSLFLREDCQLLGARAGPRCWAVPDRGHVLLTGAGGSLLGGPGARSATHRARRAPLRAGQASACPTPPSVASLGDRQQGGLPACEALPGLGAQPSGAVWARFGEGLAEASPQGQPSWGGGSPGDFVVSRRVAGGCPGSGPPRSRPPFPSPQPSAAPASALTAAAASPAQPSCATVSKASRVPAVSTVSGALPGLGPWLRAGAQRVGVTLGGWARSGLHGGGPDSETPVLGGCLCSPSPRRPPPVMLPGGGMAGADGQHWPGLLGCPRGARAGRSPRRRLPCP